MVESLFISKGDEPITLSILRQELLKIWKPIDQWHDVPLEKGFYEFSFAFF